MKQWCVPIVWQQFGKVYVEAETLEDAVDKAVGPDCPLPEGDYVDESCEAAYSIEEIREQWNDGQEDEGGQE